MQNLSSHFKAKKLYPLLLHIQTIFGPIIAIICLTFSNVNTKGEQGGTGIARNY